MLFGVAFAVVVGANLLWILPGLKQIGQNASTFQLEIAERAKVQISDFFRDIGRAAKNVSSLLADVNEEPGAVLSRFLRDYEEVSEASLLNLEGKEKAKISRYATVLPEALKDRSEDETFKKVLAGNDIVFSKVIFSFKLGPAVEIGLPVKAANGDLSGVFLFQVGLDFISDIVQGAKFGELGRVIVLDQSANVIARSDGPPVLRPENLSYLKAVKDVLELNKTVAGLEKGERYLDSDGREMFIVGIPFELLHWGVLAERPSYEALSLKNRLYIIAFISLASSTVLLVVLGFSIISLLGTSAVLKKERDQKTAIFARLTDGLLVYDKNLRVNLMNPRAENILRLKFGEVGPLTIREDFIKDERLRVLGAVFFPTLLQDYQLISGGKGKYPEVVEIYLPGADLHLQVVTTIVKDEFGVEQGFVKVIRDISRERFISRLKSEFISIAAHQLRTPLSEMKWTFSMLLDGDLGGLNPKQKTFIERGYDSNESMIKLVNNLLDISRIEEGRFGYNIKEQNIVPFVKEVAQKHQIEIERKRIQLEMNVPAVMPPAFFDPEKLATAFSIILENAVNYNKPGGKISVSLKTIPDFIEIAVEDTGIGIPKEEMKRLFTKFFRSSAVIKMQIGGTGLGLFIAKNIILNHSGDITVESEEGAGTKVIFTVPTIRIEPPKREVMFEEFIGEL